MNDLISRQAAIDDIRTLKPDGVLVDAKWIEMWLKQLPSAQPERNGHWVEFPNHNAYKCSECGARKEGD